MTPPRRELNLTKQYYPQLDSLRALSFFAIFLFHLVKIKPNGTSDRNFFQFLLDNCYLGIDVFFVLSSFLLTWLGLNEIKSEKKFLLGNYVTRRVLRIWPLYFAIMIFAFIMLPVMGSVLNIHISLPPPGWYLFFISNFYHTDHVYFLRILWSLSVEEQFYIILGLVLTFVPQHLAKIFLLFVAISILFISYSIIHNTGFYTHTLTYLLDFGGGGLAAVILFNKKLKEPTSLKLTTATKLILYLYLPLHFATFYLLAKHFPIADTVGYFIVNTIFIIAYFSFLVFALVAHDNRNSFLYRNRFLVFTGRISFGLYCFHGIVNTFFGVAFRNLNALPIVRFCIVFALTYTLALLSYRYFESFFLNLKNRFRPAGQRLNL